MQARQQGRMQTTDPATMLAALTQTNPQNLLGRETSANGRIIERYNGITIVQDPNVNIENDEERLALLAELRSHLAPPPAELDLASVNERLRDVSNRSNRPPSPSDATTIAGTPPDDEEQLQIYLNQEKQIRADLIKDGCPPCHPPEYTLPYDTEARLPKDHPAAMYYLDRSSFFNPVPLGGQLTDWRNFRSMQKAKRAKFQAQGDPEHMLNEWIEDGRYMLRKCGYPEAASLISWSMDSENQAPLQTWLEFQVDHLLRIRAHRVGAQRRIRSAIREETQLWRQGCEDRRLALHEGLLVWIEEQRVILAAAEKDKEEAQTAVSRQRGRAASSNAVDATIASALAERRRSLRVRIKTAAAAGAQQAASPATLKTQGKARVAKKLATSRSLQLTRRRSRQQHTTAEDPQGRPTLREVKAQTNEQRRMRGASRKAATSTQVPRGKQRVAKVTKQQQQVATTAPTPSTLTRCGRQVRRPTWFGSV